jgi:hypothetical protein
MSANRFLIASMALLFLPAIVSATPPRLTPEQFLKKGAGVLVGEVVDVEVVSQDVNSKRGKVMIKVREVLSGQVDIPFVIFPYKTWQWWLLGDDAGWNNVHLVKGQKLIIYFREREEDGTYHLSQSIQKGIPPYDNPEVRALYEIVDKDRTYYLDYQVDNSIQEIDSYDDPKVKALRELTGY